MYEYIFLSDLHTLLDLSSPCVWKYFQSVGFIPLYELFSKYDVNLGSFPHPEIRSNGAAYRRRLTSKVASVDDVIGFILNEFNGNVYRRSKLVNLSDYVEPGHEVEFKELYDRLTNSWCNNTYARAQRITLNNIHEYFDVHEKGGMTYDEYLKKRSAAEQECSFYISEENEKWFNEILPDNFLPLLSSYGQEMYKLSKEFYTRHRSEPVSVAMPGIVEDVVRDLITNQNHKENHLINYKKWSGDNDRKSREMMLREMWKALAYEIHAFGKVFFVVDENLYSDIRSIAKEERTITLKNGTQENISIRNIVQYFLFRIVPYSA